MRPRNLAIALALVTAAVIAGLEWHSATQRYDAAHMLERLPLDGSVKIWVDFDQLRASGLLDLLAGSAAAEDPDYRGFAQQIGFDYRTNLNGVAAVYRNGNLYAAAHGQFDFKKLDAYAQTQQGHCRDSICSVPASQPGRFVSFYPLAGEALAFASSTEPEAVRLIAPTVRSPSVNPQAPIWISMPGTTFAGLSHLPSGTQAFLSPLADSVESSFSVGTTTDRNGLQIRLDASCPSPSAASQVVVRLNAATDLLRKMLQRDHLTPGPSDLTSLLSSGKFEAHESNATGVWPLDRKLLENLASGK